MSLMTAEEYAYDAALRDCFHDCPRCRQEFAHQIDTRQCPFADLLCAPICECCEIETRRCGGYGCAFITDETGGHHWRCPNRDLEEI